MQHDEPLRSIANAYIMKSFNVLSTCLLLRQLPHSKWMTSSKLSRASDGPDWLWLLHDLLLSRYACMFLPRSPRALHDCAGCASFFDLKVAFEALLLVHSG